MTRCLDSLTTLWSDHISAIAKQGSKFILSYDLFRPATAQHKAGLAGLLLHDRLPEGAENRANPCRGRAYTHWSAFCLHQYEALQTVFNDLFDSNWEEIS